MSDLVTLNERQLATLKTTIARDCNAGEFNLYVEYCRRIELDPIRKQVIPIIFSKDNPAKRQMTIVVTIDGLRTVAERVGNYRPDEDEPRITYKEELKNGKTNPLGIEKCVVSAFKQDRRGDWYPVNGTAYWEEFAPLVKWDGEEKLDTKTLWPTKPRIMIAKCAEAQALRKGWPDHFSGIHVDAELDKARTLDADASEIVESYQTNERLARIEGGKAGILFVLDVNQGVERIEIGKLADRLVAHFKTFQTFNDAAEFRRLNRDGLQEFWAKAITDADAVKKALEQREDELRAQEFDALPEDSREAARVVGA